MHAKSNCFIEAPTYAYSHRHTHAEPGAIKAEVLSVSFVPASEPLLPNMAPTTKRWGTELKIENARAGNA